MAEAFPRSSFVGFDSHETSVKWARQAAAAAGVGDRVRFEVAGAADYAGSGYDLVAMFDACTTWVIRSGRRSMCGSRSTPAAPG